MITPVSGGVGPLTNVLLLKQCVQAWQLLGENREEHLPLPQSQTEAEYMDIPLSA